MARSHRKPFQLNPAASPAMVVTPTTIFLNSKFVGVVGAIYKAGRLHEQSPREIINRIKAGLKGLRRELVPWDEAAIEAALSYLEERGKITFPQVELAVAA